jgi:hypothetical protein
MAIKEKAKMGRPTKYSPELARKICRAIATTTDSMTIICKQNPDFPSKKVIWEWRFDYEDFRNLYIEAKRQQADLLAEEINDIADNDSQDRIINEATGREVANTEYIARSRLRVDTRKWIACKLLPKVYGEKVQNETTVTIKQEDALKELE